MIFSTTHTRVLANIFANAFACGTGTGALLATDHSIPVVQSFAILSSWIACSNLVMLLQNTARSTWADAGRFFRNRLRVWHRQARAFCHASFDSRGPHPCALAELGRLLQMGHVGPCYCSMGGGPRARLHGLGNPGALSNPCAQRAVLRRAAPAVARAPRACRRSCRASIYLPPPPRRTDPITAVIPWRPRLRRRACNTCPCLPCTGWLHPRLPASG